MNEEHGLKQFRKHHDHTEYTWHWEFSDCIWIPAPEAIGPWASFLSAMSTSWR